MRGGGIRVAATRDGAVRARRGSDGGRVMRWPFFPRVPADADGPAVPGGPAAPRGRSDVVLPRQYDRSSRRRADGPDQERIEPDVATVLAGAVADALSTDPDGRRGPSPAAVAVLVDAPSAPASNALRSPGGRPEVRPAVDELLARLAQWLPVRRLMTVAAGSDPVDVHELDELADRLGGVDAVIAIGGGRTIDAARVLAAGGRSLGPLYAGRGGSQCLLPLAAAVPLVTVPTDLLAAAAAGTVVVGTDVGRLVLTGDALRPRRRLPLPGASSDPGVRAAAMLTMVGRFLGPWHGAGLPAPQRAVFDVRALFGAGLDLSLDPAAAEAGGVLARLEELGQRAARVGGPPGRPCSWWLWPVAHEWATITDRPFADALGALLPLWSADGAATGLPQEQLDLWHEAAILLRPSRPAVTLTAADLRIVLQRVDRWWRPIGPGIPDADQVHRIFGLRRCSTA